MTMGYPFTLFQLLRGVTIASGGVLPRIHPELLSRKKGGKFPTAPSSPQPVAAPKKKTPVLTPAAKKMPPKKALSKAASLKASTSATGPKSPKVSYLPISLN